MKTRKTILVTGAAGGIGSAVSAAIVAKGYHCIGWDLRVPKSTPEMSYDCVDVADEASIREAMSKIPVDKIHGLVHCAGTVDYATINEARASEWRSVIDVNLNGTITLCQQLIPRIAREGRVVLFGSGTIKKGPPELFSYVAAKAGIRGLARSLARELGTNGITVNMVSPGFTDTPMVREYRATESANIATRAIQRPATPEDIVGPVMFFLSEASRFVTGQNLSVDGGSVMH